MKRFTFAGLSALALNVVLAPAAFASDAVRIESNFPDQHTTTFETRELASADVANKNATPPSGDSNPSDRFNTTVDDRDIINPQAKGSQPPSGDSNPSDRFNTTVDSRDIIYRQEKGGKPPSGDSNPSDRFNRTVDDRDIIYRQAN